MKRALFSVGILVGGCSFQHGGAPTGGGDGVDAPPTVDPHLDSDGDGIVDVSDNCPAVANPEQRDHDSDGRGDVCDVCPHLPDTGADADGDGVGDACDPHPTTPGDRIALFEGFYAPIGWDPVIGGGSWNVTSGQLHQTSTTGAYELVREVPVGNAFVEARVRVNGAVTTTSNRRSTGLVLGYRASDGYYFCGIAAQGSSTEVDAGEVTGGILGDTFDYNQDTFAAPMAGDWITLQASMVQPDGGDTQLDCLGHRGPVDGHASYQTSDAAMGAVGVRTNGTDASFDYVFVVEMPAPAASS
jgi:hypothetical protein